MSAKAYSLLDLPRFGDGRHITSGHYHPPVEREKISQQKGSAHLQDNLYM